MHKIGLVHRGICPENIRVMENDRCRLAGYATVGLRTAGSGLHEQLYEAIPPRSSIPPQSSRAAIPMNTALRQCSTAWCAGRPRCLQRSALWQTLTHAQNR